MSYTVLARKYRPQTFADLVGQEHVTRTLSNAIRSGRVAHAFLFTGVRGVGKTTTARIVAKALNCERGPTPEPCGVCDPCKDITLGRDTDVLEMDGASNNSVEDVRRLQESIPYRPTRDRFKIVIVDEVHMLSTGAFNAFLKTLEEPPPHVKFVFATTESHKVPVTIRSRCQRYDFRLIPQSVVANRVREILAAEKIEADDAAVAIVSHEAAGSMRDALTLLDQIVAFGGEKLEGVEVARVLGIADREVLHRVAEAVLAGEGATVLRALDEIASRGLDMLHFARQLLDLVRDMVVMRVCGADTDLCALVTEERTRASATAEGVELDELHRAFSALSKVVEDVAQSGMPRTTLEMGLVRLATRPPLRPLAELVARLDEIEKKGGGSGGGASAGGSKRGAASGAPAPSRSREAQGEGAPKNVEAPKLSPSRSRDGLGEGAPKIVEAPKIEARIEPVVVAAPPPPPPSPVPPAAGGGVAPSWPSIVASLMESKPALGAVMQHAVAIEVTSSRIVLAFPPNSFFGKQAETPEAKRALAELAERSLGARPAIEITYAEGGGKTLAQEKIDERNEKTSALKAKALSHPVVKQAGELFNVPRDRMTVRVELE